MKNKRFISRCLLLLLVVALAFSAMSCDKKDTGSSSKKATSDVGAGENPFGTGVSKEVATVLANSGDVVWYSGADGTGEYDQQFFEFFKKYYGGTISYKYCAWTDDMKTYLEDYANNDAPDYLPMAYRYWPKAGNRKLVYSVSELKEKGIVGLDHPEMTRYDDIAKASFSIGDECYAFTAVYCSPVTIGVNLDLYNEYKVKSPVEYYKEGNWNYKTFVQAAKEITRTRSDGTKISGYDGWDKNWFITANDCDLVYWKGNTLTSSIDSDQHLYNALQNLHDLYANGYTGGGFVDGKVGMCAATADNLGQYLRKCTFNWGIVPFPYGDDNTSGKVPAEVSGAGVSTAAKNVQGAINSRIARSVFDKLYYGYESKGIYGAGTYLSSYQIYENADKKNGNNDMMDMIETTTFQGRQALFMGVGNLDSAQNTFWGKLTRSDSIKDVLEEFAPIFTANCEIEMKNTKK